MRIRALPAESRSSTCLLLARGMPSCSFHVSRGTVLTVAFAASWLAAGAARSDGPVVGWGSNGSGQATPPAAVNGTDGTATAIAAGGRHSCAIQAGTGNVVCWGNDSGGQATPPAAVNGTNGTATAIAAGNSHTLAIAAPEPAAPLMSLASLGSLLVLARRRRRG